MLAPILFLIAVTLLGGIFELHSWWRKQRAHKQVKSFHAWRKEQQSKWRVTHPPAHAENFNPWDDIPVFAQKVEK